MKIVTNHLSHLTLPSCGVCRPPKHSSLPVSLVSLTEISEQPLAATSKGIMRSVLNLWFVVLIAGLTPAVAQSIGAINIRDEGSLTIVDFIPIVVAALAWCYFWRLLIRWNRKPAFRYWFPSLMLIVMSSLMWGSARISLGTALGALGEVVAGIVLWLNFPAAAVTGLLMALWIERVPHWAGMVVAAAIFWMSWHLLLRYLAWRASDNIPIALNLGVRSSSGR